MYNSALDVAKALITFLVGEFIDLEMVDGKGNLFQVGCLVTQTKLFTYLDGTVSLFFIGKTDSNYFTFEFDCDKGRFVLLDVDGEFPQNNNFWYVHGGNVTGQTKEGSTILTK